MQQNVLDAAHDDIFHWGWNSFLARGMDDDIVKSANTMRLYN